MSVPVSCQPLIIHFHQDCRHHAMGSSLDMHQVMLTSLVTGAHHTCLDLPPVLSLSLLWFDHRQDRMQALTADANENHHRWPGFCPPRHLFIRAGHCFCVIDTGLASNGNWQSQMATCHRLPNNYLTASLRSQCWLHLQIQTLLGHPKAEVRTLGAELLADYIKAQVGNHCSEPSTSCTSGTVQPMCYNSQRFAAFLQQQPQQRHG